MKIRRGFVSNSSSTSFCIYGTYIRMSGDEKHELYDAAEKTGLSTRNDQYGDGLYIGRNWSSIGDDETGKEFKESTQLMVNSLPLPELEKRCSTIQEGWWDG